MTQIIEIPFVAGQNEGVDSKLLDPAVGLRLLQNGRITRDGRIEVRPQFSALSVTAWGLGSDVAAFDLATFEDRLLAFGERSGTMVTYPPGNMCVIANTSQTLLCYVDASSNAQLYTRNSTTGAAVVGPTNVLGPGFSTANCVGTPALMFTTSSRVIIECSANTGTTVRSLYAVRDTNPHTLIASGDHDDVFISSKLYSQTRNSSGSARPSRTPSQRTL